MGGCLLFPNSLLQFQSSSSPLGFPNSLLSIKEFRDRRSFCVRADARKGSKSDDFDAKSPLSPNKEEILALFKRIQSSISTASPNKITSKNAEDSKPSPSAESILEILHQSRPQRKGKAVAKKGGKFVAAQKDAVKKDESAEDVSTRPRPPSSFMKRSPIPALSSPREEVEPEKEITARDETEVKSQVSTSATDDERDEEAVKLEGMKLPQLKEVAKSRGIKGYSKLKKSELVELLLNS